MIEELWAYAILWQTGLMEKDEYVLHLDHLFWKEPENELLSELEWSTSDIAHTLYSIREYMVENTVDCDSFGRILFQLLEDLYCRSGADLAYFAAGTYAVWQLLPVEINQIDPFHILSYADDPLSWGDVQQARELYTRAFQFYQRRSL